MPESSPNQTHTNITRRGFMAGTIGAMATGQLVLNESMASILHGVVIDTFDRPDSLYHGDGWETLNPGYWSIKDGALHRRLRNVGDRARRTGFPYHYETHQETTMPVEYDPSLPAGILWRRDWKLANGYVIAATFTIGDDRVEPRPSDDPNWNMYTPGYGMMGVAFGGKELHEGFGIDSGKGSTAFLAVYRDDGTFGIVRHGATDKPISEIKKLARPLQVSEHVQISVEVHHAPGDSQARIEARLKTDDETLEIRHAIKAEDRPNMTEGYFGIVGRGLFDFAVNRVGLIPFENQPLETPINDCQVCYALGDSLREVDGEWRVTFIGMFRSDGDLAAIRMSDSESPEGGWENVSVAGSAPIVSNDFRCNTAVIDVVLPRNPADATLYYTVWKDGKNVTSDPRLSRGSRSVGVGTGFVGTVPSSGEYVGRLPQLNAPYRLCGLSCHAIDRNSPNLPNHGAWEGWYVHDQPDENAWRHLDDYKFQIMLWEDDVWYLEHLIYTPSTDDAYKIITTTLAGPTTRWQMMRHWNVINPGDHDHGMDDVKGPEQIAIRARGDLGQDPDYMRRNFQIVSHLVQAEENPSPTGNPKRWRRWKMPNRDFSLVICDSRLWRSSQDTRMWDDEGWGGKENLYDRRDPTRALLGEEQFAWLREIIRTDTSRIICVDGINGLHTVWDGGGKYSKTGEHFKQRDRVAADYAGWVAAGADRVIELLSSRDGVVSVYGDVHIGSIMKNTEHRLYECSFGPIGRTGGRQPKPGFARRMTDHDGRDLEMIAFYHHNYESPELEKRQGPQYWNFLDMHFDPNGERGEIGLKVCNLIDAPTDGPRGGGAVDVAIAGTGRPVRARLPKLKTLPDADVHFARLDGSPVRGTRSLPGGGVVHTGFADVEPGEALVMTVNNGRRAEASIVKTEPA